MIIWNFLTLSMFGVISSVCCTLNPSLNSSAHNLASNEHPLKVFHHSRAYSDTLSDNHILIKLYLLRWPWLRTIYLEGCWCLNIFFKNALFIFLVCFRWEHLFNDIKEMVERSLSSKLSVFCWIYNRGFRNMFSRCKLCSLLPPMFRARAVSQ